MEMTTLLTDEQTALVQQIACDRASTPSAMLEEALEKLFRRIERETAEQEERAYLEQLIAEGANPDIGYEMPPFNPDNVRVTHAVYVNPTAFRAYEE